MFKRILLIGQCTLHWGRMEYGNIGNYYIIEPFVRELHKTFPDAEIITTFQMTDEFCEKEKISCIPMDSYYGWKKTDLWKCLYEVAASWLLKYLKLPFPKTTFIKAVLDSDLIIDFSGDIWSDNADFIGKNRFFIGTCKDYIAYLLGKPIVMLAGSPGPFQNSFKTWLAKKVFSKFSLVTNREPVSTRLLEKWGFPTSRVKTFACPAFLFESKTDDEIKPILESENLVDINRPTVGFILCGWNMLEAPYTKWPRRDDEFAIFADAVEYIVRKLGARVCLMSHSNGFELPPNFKMIHGRDYPFAEKMYEIMHKRSLTDNDVFILKGIYSPAETKAIIRNFDMLVTGRVHAACAALSQYIPTVIIDYGHDPKAHKLEGFAEVAGIQDYVADPAKKDALKEKINKCWSNRKIIKGFLTERIPNVKKLAQNNFSELTKI